jgi:hypothetical protein
MRLPPKGWMIFAWRLIELKKKKSDFEFPWVKEAGLELQLGLGHACNPSTPKAEAGRSWVPVGQPRLHSETLSRNKQRSKTSTWRHVTVMKICPANFLIFLTLPAAISLKGIWPGTIKMGTKRRCWNEYVVKWSPSVYLLDTLFCGSLHLWKCPLWGAAQVSFYTVIHRRTRAGGGKPLSFCIGFWEPHILSQWISSTLISLMDSCPFLVLCPFLTHSNSTPTQTI